MPITLPMLCRMDDAVVLLVKEGRRSLTLFAVLVAITGAAMYGFAFGLWRAPEQALYSAIKMPAMIVSLMVISSMVNIMLAFVMGSRLTAVQTTTCVLLSLALTSVLLAAFSPVVLYFALQSPPPGSSSAMLAYRTLLVANTMVVAVAGLAGNIRLYQLLCRLTGTSRMAWSVLLGWIFVTGLTGCELSWVFSPFLARPECAVSFLNPDAFSNNFFEYLWHTGMGLFR